MGLESLVVNALKHILDSDDSPSAGVEKSGSANAPLNAYVRDAREMARPPADVKEYPNSYQFTIDMPGLKGGDIKVQVKDNNVLVISGKRKREEEKGGFKYRRKERPVGNFTREFKLPENANVEAIIAVCQDGVLTVTVDKKPKTFELKITARAIIEVKKPPTQPKTIEVKIA